MRRSIAIDSSPVDGFGREKSSGFRPGGVRGGSKDAVLRWEEALLRDLELEGIGLV